MSSPPSLLTDTEEELSDQSNHTLRNPEEFQSTSEYQSSSHNMNDSGSSESRSFETAIQKYSKDLIKSLSNFKFSEELTDENYILWSQAVSELLQSIDLDSFITVDNHNNSFLSAAKNLKTRFIVTMFILNHLDSNNNLQARNHLSDPNDPQILVYDPYKIWIFLKNRHARITEVKLSVVTKALYACAIGRNDTLSAYLDKFENLIREFYLYKGQMSDHQSARMLVDSISSLSETTRELIHAQVVPFSRQGVSDYLREYETRQGWVSPAMREANAVDGSNSSRPKKSQSRTYCTREICHGPHPPEECWSKPENSKKKEDYLARRHGVRKSYSSPPQAPSVRGRKKISPPSANAAAIQDSISALSLHAEYDEVESPSAAVTSTSSTSGQIWALHDTGATHHLFNDRRLFDKNKLKPVNDSNKRLKLAGGEMSIAVHSKGSVRLKAGDGTVFELTGCLYVPELSKNLISGGRLRLKGVREFFDEGDNQSFSLVLKGLALFNGYIGYNGLMNVAIDPVSPIHLRQNVIQPVVSDSSLQHRQFGHIGNRYLKAMSKHGSVDGMSEMVDVENCETCSLSKNTQLPYNHTRPRANRFLENIHTDLSGIMRVKGLCNESYYILFCDNFSSYRHICPLRSKEKEEIYEVFMSYIALAERQTGSKVIQFTLDRGGEFINDLLMNKLKSLGIILHTTAGYTPQQNGVAERGNRTVITKARSMMIEASLPLHFWFLACKTAFFLINRSVTTTLTNHTTLFEVWFFRKPSITHLRVFGCKAFRLLRKEIRLSKYHPVSAEGVLVGYDQDNFNYLIYDLASRKLIMSHDVTFLENEFPFDKSSMVDKANSGPVSAAQTPQPFVKLQFFDESDHEEEGTSESEVTPRAADDPVSTQLLSPGTVDRIKEVTPLNELENSVDNSQPNPPSRAPVRSSTRNKGKTISYKGMSHHVSVEAVIHTFDCLPAVFSTTAIGSVDDTPRSLKSALQSYDGRDWLDACKKEVTSLAAKSVWTLCPRPLNKKVIRGLWLFKRKVKMDGSIKHKSRYVAMGNTQVAGEDYGETFAPTGKPSSLRVLVAIAATQGWEVHQMDAVTAFLNSDLSDEVYVERPKGFKDEDHPTWVWKLNKSLYGLKQSPKLWQDDVKAFLTTINFSQCEIDPCIYIRNLDDGVVSRNVHITQTSLKLNSSSGNM